MPEMQPVVKGYAFKKKIMSKAENLRQDRRPTVITEAYFVKIVNDIHSLLTIFAKKLHLRCLTGFRIRLLIVGES